MHAHEIVVIGGLSVSPRIPSAANRQTLLLRLLSHHGCSTFSSLWISLIMTSTPSGSSNTRRCFGRSLSLSRFHVQTHTCWRIWEVSLDFLDSQCVVFFLFLDVSQVSRKWCICACCCLGWHNLNLLAVRHRIRLNWERSCCLRSSLSGLW